MTIDKPGKKFYKTEVEWTERFDAGDFPPEANIDIDRCAPAPDGWVLTMVWIGYTETDDVFITARYCAAGSDADIGPEWAGEITDLEWDEGEGWRVETAWDDGESGLNELDWTIHCDQQGFKTSRDMAFEFMEVNGEFSSRFET